MKRVYGLDEWKILKEEIKSLEEEIVFTNGCFDLLHPGHIMYLNKVKTLGKNLVVGLNSDLSVKRIKGNRRPIIDENSRAYMLLNLKCVDYVVLFDENTPENLIEYLQPNIHVKGGDYTVEQLPEAKIVFNYGGDVKIVNGGGNFSTTKLIDLIKRS